MLAIMLGKKKVAGLYASGYKLTAEDLNQEESYPMGKLLYDCL